MGVRHPLLLYTTEYKHMISRIDRIYDTIQTLVYDRIQTPHDRILTRVAMIEYKQMIQYKH